MNTSKFQKYLPYIAVGVTLVYFGYYFKVAYSGYLFAPKASASSDYNYRDFGRIPVIDQGRYKPIDTVARSYLTIIMHRPGYYDADAKVSYPATKWLLDVLTTPPPAGDDELEELFKNGADERPAWKQKVFRIENDELLRLLGLQMREGLRYSFMEIVKERPRFGAFLKEVQRVRDMEAKQFTRFDAKVHELSEHMQMVIRLSAHSAPLVIPEANGGDQWKSFRDGLYQFGPLANDLPAGSDAVSFAFYRDLLRHYDQGEKAEFNKTLDKFLAHLQAEGKLTRTNTEVVFNEFEPFWLCLLTYIVLALCGCLSWLTLAWSSSWSQPIRKAAFAAMIVAFCVHLSGLIIRMYLQNRMFVFVTNLYSSAVFIGLGCIFVCLIAEAFYRNGIALVVGGVTGFCTLYIAHRLSLDGDTMIMMQAVLDTNFWLATHVTCVTLGYTMAFVAGFMGIAYIFLGLFTDMLRKEGSAILASMTYGVLCAGMFLSFVGTVLGGLWADYSWGRFWGWDPKENGALLIVIWIALILHARWGGMVKHRGMAVLSVLGIIITAWSWFGTNFLGVGLHAYGGAKGGAMQALIFIDFGFLVIAGLGCLPLHLWRSFQPQRKVETPPSLPPSSSLNTGVQVKPKRA